MSKTNTHGLNFYDRCSRIFTVLLVQHRMYSVGVLHMHLRRRGFPWSSTNRSPCKSLIHPKISVNSACVNLNVSWKFTGSKSSIRLMGPIFQVHSRVKSNNVYKNTHTHRVNTTPVPNPLFWTISNTCWRLRWVLIDTCKQLVWSTRIGTSKQHSGQIENKPVVLSPKKLQIETQLCHVFLCSEGT